MTRFLSLLLLLKVSTLTDASAVMIQSNCTDFTYPEGDGIVARELCFSVQIYWPSIAITELPNGTEITQYVGESSWNYIFEGELTGLTTVVSWEGDDAEDCVATADGQECQLCTLCNDGTSFDADCTNLENGRIVECGEIASGNEISDDGVYLPFFPFSSTYVYAAGGSNTTTTAAAGGAPSESVSAAAFLQGGLMAIVGTFIALVL
jgi:hypothetical protein